MTTHSNADMHSPTSADLIAALITFASAARPPLTHAGHPHRVSTMMEALQHLSVASTPDLYWSGRHTLCSTFSDLEPYDVAFESFFGSAEMPTSLSAPPRFADLPQLPAEVGSGVRPQGERRQLASPPAHTTSERSDRNEVLRHMDIRSMSQEANTEVNALLAQLSPRTSARRSRRYRTTRHGSIDVEQSARALLHPLEQHHELRFRRRSTTPRKLVIVVDVSGSMARYSEALLRFAHAALRSSNRRTEVFTLGTRLTRITRALQAHNVEAALAGAGSSIPDWRGGTRLGEMLHDFITIWGRRGLAKGAVVVICSDGWERGDPTLLGEQMGHLARLAYRIVWVNPHSGKEGFRPETGGMTAVLPHIDELVSGHTLSALTELSKVIGRA